jgi:endo-1,4-beta-xylanase
MMLPVMKCLAIAAALLSLTACLAVQEQNEQRPPADAALFFINEAQLLADTDARIRQARTAVLRIQVQDAQGKPVPGQVVHVTHVRHRFFFGTLFQANLMPQRNETEVDKKHRELFLRLFNYSTILTHWGSYEPRAGQYGSEERIRYARWLTEQGLAVRGHPVFWNRDNFLPRWLMERNPAPADLYALFDQRLKEMSETLLPELRDADIFNELINWERFRNPLTWLLQKEGTVAVATRFLKEARRLNPNLLLVVNDYDRTPAYHQLLQRLLEAGAPIDIIGQQSHMHDGTWSPAETWRILNRLSQLGRPVLFTEHSVLSGPWRKIGWRADSYPYYQNWETDPVNEQRQADYLEQFYRLSFSHANCAGIVLWNYSDRGAWLGAPVGVLRKDGTPKPAYERLDTLINRQWRTQGEFVTDAHGEVVLPHAFEGEYELKTGETVARGEHSPKAPLRVTMKK